jgi:RNA polymerase sigma-70 factor, ECF subfamily
MGDSAHKRRFELLALPHLDAAYNLARWLTASRDDAEDVVQEAYLRAFTYFAGFEGEEFRPWLLSIVRRTAYTWLQTNRPREIVGGMDDMAMTEIEAQQTAAFEAPDAGLLRDADKRLVDELIGRLPAEFREVIVLREIEELSYREIADIAGIPIGTVMSRLARARRLLEEDAARHRGKDAACGL